MEYLSAFLLLFSLMLSNMTLSFVMFVTFFCYTIKILRHHWRKFFPRLGRNNALTRPISP